MAKTTQTIYAIIVFIVMLLSSYIWGQTLINSANSTEDTVIKYALYLAIFVTAGINTFLAPMLILAGRNIRPKNLFEGFMYLLIGNIITIVLLQGVWKLVELILIPGSIGWIIMASTLLLVTVAVNFFLPNYKIISET